MNFVLKGNIWGLEKTEANKTFIVLLVKEQIQIKQTLDRTIEMKWCTYFSFSYFLLHIHTVMTEAAVQGAILTTRRNSGFRVPLLKCPWADHQPSCLFCQFCISSTISSSSATVHPLCSSLICHLVSLAWVVSPSWLLCFTLTISSPLLLCICLLEY